MNAYSPTPDQIEMLISLKRSKTLLGSKDRKSASEDEKIAINDLKRCYAIKDIKNDLLNEENVDYFFLLKTGN